MSDKSSYPYDEGDVTVLGPECFVARDGSVLCWKGVNYVPQEGTIAVDALLSDEAAGTVAAIIENRCGLVRGIGPAVREALSAIATTGREV